jgi:hypothetical protein
MIFCVMSVSAATAMHADAFLFCVTKHESRVRVRQRETHDRSSDSIHKDDGHLFQGSR